MDKGFLNIPKAYFQDNLKISVPCTIIIFVIETGQCGVNVFKGHIMFLTPDPGAKMHHASFVEVKIYNRRTTKIAHMCAFKRFFAMHAQKIYNFAPDEFQTALLVEASIRGTEIEDSHFALLFNPELDTGTAIEKHGVVHERLAAMRTFYFKRDQVFCHINPPGY